MGFDLPTDNEGGYNVSISDMSTHKRCSKICPEKGLDKQVPFLLQEELTVCMM